jgi:hypothetical protein
VIISHVNTRHSMRLLIRSASCLNSSRLSIGRRHAGLQTGIRQGPPAYNKNITIKEDDIVGVSNQSIVFKMVPLYCNG